MTMIHGAVGDLELEPAEKREIWRPTRRELPYLWNRRTSYFVFGSYRGPYIRRLCAVQNELTRQLGAYPFIMGDLIGLPTNRLNAFDIMFLLLATYSDYIVSVFEKESGGEAPGLGEIDDPLHFKKSCMYPRDYSWIADAHLESKHHVIQAALEIAFTDDLTGDKAASKIRSLLKYIQDTGIDIVEDEVWEVLNNRTDTGGDPTAYSWVHLSKFRKFELYDRCFPWTTEEELRAAVAELPSPTPRPEWEERDES